MIADEASFAHSSVLDIDDGIAPAGAAAPNGGPGAP
jgi:hypothetical protein